MDHSELLEAQSSKFDAKFYALNKALVGVIEDYSLLQMLPMNIKKDESLDMILQMTDSLIQFGEQEEPQDNAEDAPDEEAAFKQEPMI